MARIGFTPDCDRDVIAGVTTLLTTLAGGIDYARPPLLKFTKRTNDAAAYEPQIAPHGYVPCVRPRAARS